MSVAAVEICEEQKISFAKVFSQQFVMSPKGGLSLPGFQHYGFAGWHLYVGGTLPVAIAQLQDQDRELIVLGRAVDTEGHLVTSERLASVLPTLSKLDDLQAYVAGLGGRYVAFVQQGKTKRCYLDPSGTMGVVANQQNHMVGSTLYMVMTDRTRPESNYPQGSQPRRAAFGYTADKDVRALTPNHYFDLSDQTETRHWPNEESFECRSLEDLDAGIDQVVHRHGQIISAMSDTYEPVILPLSGGEDSRQLFAMTRHQKCPIDLHFTHVTTWKTQSDAEIAQHLCDTTGIRMETYRCNSPDTSLPPRLVRRLLTERAVATGSAEVRLGQFSPKVMGNKFRQLGRELAAARRTPVGGTILRGHVTDIGKAFLWRQVGIRAYVAHGGAGISPETGVKLLMLDDEEAHKDPWFQQKFRSWQASLPVAAQDRSIDFMGLELYRTYSLGTLLYALNRNFYMPPGCDRQIIQNLISVSPRLRYDLHLNDRLLARTAPALMDIPYARSSDNKMRNQRPDLETNLDLYQLEAAPKSKVAATPIKPIATGPIRTPLLRSDLPNDKILWIKNEAAQPSGSFKIRGPNAFLDRNPVPSGVVTTASTSNHAIALSMAATARGLEAKIMMPNSTSEAGLNAIREAGGTVTLVDGDYEQALARARMFAAVSGAQLVPNYDHEDVIYGNQQIFEEIKEDLWPISPPVFAPVGGGGILSGAIQAYDTQDTQITAVELAPYQRVQQIVWDGAKEIPPFTTPPLASTEGVAIRTLGLIPTQIIGAAKHLSLASVTTDDLQEACRWLWFQHGIRAELGGCTALAGALRTLRDTSTTEAVCVISGGNISEALHHNIVQETTLRSA